MEASKELKVYVAVKADFREDGIMMPRVITWENGEKYEIDRVLDIRQAAAMKPVARATVTPSASGVSKAICTLNAVPIRPGIISAGGL